MMSFLKLSTLFVMLASVYVSNQQVISNICTLPVDSGSCDGRILNYYYDSAAGECEYFYYGGCGGNSNRFLTKTECMLKCTLLTRGQVCTMPAIEGPCEAYIPSFYYDANVDKCQRFVYGGCGGNANRFITKADCMEMCG